MNHTDYSLKISVWKWWFTLISFYQSSVRIREGKQPRPPGFSSWYSLRQSWHWCSRSPRCLVLTGASLGCCCLDMVQWGEGGGGCKESFWMYCRHRASEKPHFQSSHSQGLMLGKRFFDLFQGRSASEAPRSCSSLGSSWGDKMHGTSVFTQTFTHEIKGEGFKLHLSLISWFTNFFYVQFTVKLCARGLCVGQE